MSDYPPTNDCLFNLCIIAEGIEMIVLDGRVQLATRKTLAVGSVD
jgi:hypothetical protein